MSFGILNDFVCCVNQRFSVIEYIGCSFFYIGYCRWDILAYKFFGLRMQNGKQCWMIRRTGMGWDGHFCLKNQIFRGPFYPDFCQLNLKCLLPKWKKCHRIFISIIWRMSVRSKKKGRKIFVALAWCAWHYPFNWMSHSSIC